MATWTVELLPSAETELRGLPKPLQKQALDFLAQFEEDPFPPDSIPLDGFMNLFRVRIDGYRIVYQAVKSRRKVTVLRVRPRGVVYRGLEP